MALSVVSPNNGLTANIIDPNDPSYVLVRAVQELQKQSLKDLGALVQKLSDDVAASAVLAEKSAQAKAERIVSDAGEWASRIIREAGEQAAKKISEQAYALDERLGEVERFLLRATFWTMTCTGIVVATGAIWALAYEGLL